MRRDYVYKPGDRVTWFKSIGTTKYKKIPAVFIKYTGINARLAYTIDGDVRVVGVPLDCFELTKG